jgi:hypothetical protein
MNNSNNISSTGKEDPLAALAKMVINDRLVSLNTDTKYTVKELFGDTWLGYDDGLRSDIGKVVRALVQQQRFPLLYAGKNGSNAHQYFVLKHNVRGS